VDPWTRRILKAAILLAAAVARSEPLGIELVGFGASGPPRAYTSQAWVPLRYRVRGHADARSPIPVVLRRDDGATVVIPEAPPGEAVQVAEVPLRSGRFSLNEYEAFLAPTTGPLVPSSGSVAIVRVAAGPEAASLAEELESTRSRLQGDRRLVRSPRLLQPTPQARERPSSFEAALVPGEDLLTELPALD